MTNLFKPALSNPINIMKKEKYIFSKAQKELSLGRFYLRQNLLSTMLKVMAWLFLSVLACLLNSIGHFAPWDIYRVFPLLFLCFAITQLWFGITRRLYVDDYTLAFSNWKTLHLSFSKLQRSQVRKIVKEGGQIHFLGSQYNTLASIPASTLNIDNLQLLVAALPCFSSGIFKVQ